MGVSGVSPRATRLPIFVFPVKVGFDTQRNVGLLQLCRGRDRSDDLEAAFRFQSLLKLALSGAHHSRVHTGLRIQVIARRLECAEHDNIRTPIKSKDYVVGRLT